MFRRLLTIIAITLVLPGVAQANDSTTNTLLAPSSSASLLQPNTGANSTPTTGTDNQSLQPQGSPPQATGSTGANGDPLSGDNPTIQLLQNEADGSSHNLKDTPSNAIWPQLALSLAAIIILIVMWLLILRPSSRARLIHRLHHPKRS